MYFSLFTDAGKRAMPDAVDVLLHYCEEMFRKVLYITEPEAEENDMMKWSDTGPDSDETYVGQDNDMEWESNNVKLDMIGVMADNDHDMEWE
jgi:hypothetical protein